MDKRKMDTLIKLRKIFMAGYVPSRAIKNYTAVSTKLANCLEHAIFNLEDDTLISDFNFDDLETFANFINSPNDTPEDISGRIFSMVDDVGLKVKRENFERPILKKNEWLVALYFNGVKDFHLLLKQDKVWTGKMGIKDKIEIFEELPKEIKQNDARFGERKYSLYGLYTIKNDNVPTLEK